MYQRIVLQINIEADTVPNFLFDCSPMALTLFTLVPAITQAFGISTSPNVTAACTRGEALHLKESTETVLRATALFSAPTDMGPTVMAGPAARLVFSTRPLLSVTSHVPVIMGVGAIFVSFSTSVNSMPQAAGRVDLPVKFLAVGLTIKVTLNYFLVGTPEINVLSADAGTLIRYFFLMVAVLVCLCCETRIMSDFPSISGKPFTASILCCAAVWSTRRLFSYVLSENLSALGGVGTTVLVYSPSLLCLRTACRDDILMFLNGQKTAKILERHRWIR